MATHSKAETASGADRLGSSTRSADTPPAANFQSAERMHVVIVDEGLPYPPDSGKRIRTLNLLLPLARRHRITYLCYPSSDPAETRDAIEFLQGRHIETVLVDRGLPVNAGLSFYGRLAWNLLSRLPYSVQVHNTAAVRRAIRRYAAANHVDLWQAEWTPYAESLCGTLREPWIIMAHNVESLIWQRYSETETNRLKRWYINQQWHKFERFERKMFARAARTVTVSDVDSHLARTRFGATGLSVVENGVDVSRFASDGSRRDPNQILFLGSLDWRPNQDAVALLLDRVFPEVVRTVPAARLTIVGRKPPQWLVKRTVDRTNVELCANVPDVRPFVWRCGVMAVPLRIGGGSRLKILEALAAQCPVVSTKVGAEGLCLIPDEHYLEANTVESIVARLVECIRNPQAARETARRGRELVASRYDWSILAEKLDAVWQEQRCRA